MNKHTPGPWKQGKSGGISWYNIYANNETVRVARVFDPSPAPNHKAEGFEIEEANARLIAAAPELLEALEEIATQAGGTFHNNPELAKGVLQARAAIAKAKGE